MRPGLGSVGSKWRRRMLTELFARTRNACRSDATTGSNTTWRLPGNANVCQFLALGGVTNRRSDAWRKTDTWP